VVYLAEQDAPVRRRVAIKLIRGGVDSARVLARFHDERRSLARMNHDAIARLYDAGTHDDGQPFFVMEHIEGAPITQHCAETGAGITERVALFRRVCDAVEHAHRRGIIHRDLKPSNILVAHDEGQPRPKVIDFGLARALDADQRAAAQTLPGQLMGTPEYMSPEQAADPGGATDVRVDVYALGVVLYELLAGVIPIEGLRELPLAEMLRCIAERDPVPPRLRSDEPIDRDLDAIVMRALEKSPDARYQSVAQLADDLDRFARNEPVRAARQTTWYRARKFARRHRLGVSVAIAMASSLLLGLAFFIWQFTRAELANRQVEYLALTTRIEQARTAQEELRPAWPRHTAALAAWLRETGEPIVAVRPELQRVVSNLDREGDAATAFQRYLLRSLQALLGELDAFEREVVADVRDRLSWSRTVRQRTIEDHAEAWERAIGAVRAADGVRGHEGYRGLELTPQLGLVPLGIDPRSLLCEFVHLRSGEPGAGPPPRDPESGKLLIGPEHGVVFVLLPGATFLMGAVPHDEQAMPEERPAHEVTLDAFFLAKHELTRSQWRRLSGGARPSTWRGYPGQPRDDRMLPVETIGWHEVDRLLRWRGLELPTEAQWEYGCRAGTDSIWSTGNEASSLRGFANVADLSAKLRGPGAGLDVTDAEDWDDGHVLVAPVGSLAANDFGLHDMHGNVAEWCRDGNLPFSVPARSGDGLRGRPEQWHVRAYRGGGFGWRPRHGRCSDRDGLRPNDANAYGGARAARRLQ
ncbi:MAG: SUMF1/EgtB/PvdO family nonheme iron enzyme, partial [Planctomycetes bacterium]|nr:SUMF1/EgtB/PvdO family nonheme iron enzyme [Planctomycetota bacterium]